MRDSVTAERRHLPMVSIEKEYTFSGPDGTVTLPDLFGTSRQLIIQHFMFDAAWDAGCPECSAACDEISPHLISRLQEAGTAFAAVSLAPLSKIIKYKAWRGWDFPWYSSYGTDFNYDFHVTLDETVAPVMYDFESKEEILAGPSSNELVNAAIPVEIPGLSCFLLAEGTVFHTYSAHELAVDAVSPLRTFLELTALGGHSR